MNDVIEALRELLLERGSEFGLELLGAVAILLGGWVVSRWVGGTVGALANRTDRLGPTLAPVIGKAVRLVVFTIAFVAALAKLGIDTTSLIAALGAVGVGVGLALKNTLSDIASGIVLLMLRPFDVGEDADIGGVEGTIRTIDLFEVKLTGFDGVPIVLPNTKVREGRIRNFSRAARRRIDFEVGVDYAADVDAAIRTIFEMLGEDERVLGDPEPLINVVSLGDSSVNLLVRYWLPPAGWIPAHLDVHRKIKLALDGAGISIPFPQRVLSMRDAA